MQSPRKCFIDPKKSADPALETTDLVDLLANFDPIMGQHLQHVTNAEICNHYLGKRIQNELITVVADAVVNAILQDIKNAMYFSIILDCTPDIQ